MVIPFTAPYAVPATRNGGLCLNDCLFSIPTLGGAEAVVALTSEDQMVCQRDAQAFTRGPQPARQLDVLAAW